MVVRREKQLIRELWEQNAATEFASRGVSELTGREVREYMSGVLDTLAPKLHGDPLFIFVYWQPLTPDERAGVLAELFPDGGTYRRDNRPEPPN